MDSPGLCVSTLLGRRGTFYERRKVKIPKRFKLMGRTITVVWRDELFEDRNYAGMADYTRGEIHLQKKTNSFPTTECAIQHSFCHELMHWIFYMANQTHEKGNDLHTNENLVDASGGLLLQFLETAEY